MNRALTETLVDLRRTVQVGLRSTVAKNAASLYLIQFANYIVPLIMVPYLVRVLGPRGYGAAAFVHDSETINIWQGAKFRWSSHQA